MTFEDLPGIFRMPFEVPPRSTSLSDGSQVIFVAPCNVKVKRVVIVADEGITGADTNNFAWKLYNRGANGQGTTLLATHTFASGVNLAALTPFELYKPSTPLKMAPGEFLDLYWDKNGTGIAQPRCFGWIEFEGD